MAHAAAPPSTAHDSPGHAAAPAHPADHQAPITPGKVAMWLFLATEVMFFTGLIGSYIVLRSGSAGTSYSNLYAPGTDLNGKQDMKGVRLLSAGADEAKVAEIIAKAAGVGAAEAKRLIEHGPGLVVRGVAKEKAAEAAGALEAIGAKAEVEDLKTYNWPLPYDTETNPLSIDLTALNTFVLICSSVTMVLALGAIQRGDKTRCWQFLLATVIIGSCFLGVQVYEYRSLMFEHHYPLGISKSTHFTPNVSLFASCFFTMTGFHGAHVAGGVVMLTCMLIGALMGKFSREHHAPLELVGLYWHFVDLVWIILFTVVYLI